MFEIALSGGCYCMKNFQAPTHLDHMSVHLSNIITSASLLSVVCGVQRTTGLRLPTEASNCSYALVAPCPRLT